MDLKNSLLDGWQPPAGRCSSGLVSAESRCVARPMGRGAALRWSIGLLALLVASADAQPSAEPEEAIIANYLSAVVGVATPSAVAEYAKTLVGEGYDTAALFDTISLEDLREEFFFKRGHVKAVEIFREGKRAGPAAAKEEESPAAQLSRLHEEEKDGEDGEDEEGEDEDEMKVASDEKRRQYFRKHSVDELLQLPVMAGVGASRKDAAKKQGKEGVIGLILDHLQSQRGALSALNPQYLSTYAGQ